MVHRPDGAAGSGQAYRFETGYDDVDTGRLAEIDGPGEADAAQVHGEYETVDRRVFRRPCRRARSIALEGTTMNVSSPEFWIALAQIIGVNIVLSGDNAVVIALAARGLPAQQQKQAVPWGSGAAVVMRIVLTIVAVELLRLPYLKLVGAVLLLWIAIQLLVPEDEGEGHGTDETLAAAIKTILLADLVMSLDNVIAVAAAAKGKHAAGHRPGDLDSAGGVRQPPAAHADGALPGHHHAGRRAARLGGRRHGGHRSDRQAVGRRQAAFLHWGAPAGLRDRGRCCRQVAGGPQDGRARRACGARPVLAAAAPGRLRRVLLAVDGSAGAAQAVRRAVALRDELREPQRSTCTC